MRADNWLLSITAVASAVFGGGMFVFSAFVLPALRDLPARDGVAAMQAINVRAPQAPLLVVMAITALGAATVIGRAVFADLPYAGLAVAGAALALLGLAITVVGNVPLNDRLAGVDPKSAGAAGEWTAYVLAWTRWNHARSLANIAGAIVLVLAARA